MAAILQFCMVSCMYGYNLSIWRLATWPQYTHRYVLHVQ